MGEQSPAPPTHVAAALCSQEPPSVTTETAADDDGAAERVLVEGTMFHDGLNRNAWGLSAEGAERIATSLEGRDFTASHPFIRNGVYDRGVAGGQGMPIGTVVDTDVTTVDAAAALEGGEYTATYTAEVRDPAYAQRYQSGLYTQEGYGVSIGIYGNPDAATCSACGEAMGSEACGHTRGEEVEASDGETTVAGPIYDDGQSDHLAAVYMPAYQDADASVSTDRESSPAASRVATMDHDAAGHPPPLAASVLASPFDETAADADANADANANASETASANADAAADERLVRVATDERHVRRDRSQDAVTRHTRIDTTR